MSYDCLDYFRCARYTLEDQVLLLTPETFWSQYKAEIQARGAWSAYQHSKLWTPIAISAAESVCQKSFGLQTAREYFRVDVIGWIGRWNNREYDYDLRVAFEAEDGVFWEDELCKLAHIVSDLRVLLAYQTSKSRRAEMLLNQHLVRHKRRVIRDCNCKWLFIFGPHPKNRNDCWAAYSVDELGQIQRLPEERPLRGIDMME